MHKRVLDLKEKILGFSDIHWHLEKRYQYSIYSTIVTGFIAYVYYMTHNIHNYDNIFQLPHGNGTGVPSGRWLLTKMDQVMNALFGNGGYFHTTVINTVAAVFLVGICCLLLIDIFELEKPLECIAITAVTVAFPTIGATMVFNFTVMYYMVAFVFCTLAVWLVKRDKWYGEIAAVFLIAMGLGTYQSYFSYAASLMVVLLIQQVVSLENSIKIMVNVVKYLGILALSFGVYMVITKYFLWKNNMSEMISYQGLDQMGKLKLTGLPQLVTRAYREFFSLTYQNYTGLSAAGSVQKLFMIMYGFVLLGGVSA